MRCNLITYEMKNGAKVFQIEKEINKHWNIELEDVVGHKLQDRLDENHTVEISGWSNMMGIICVHFKEGGYLALDHAINQFESIKSE